MTVALLQSALELMGNLIPHAAAQAPTIGDVINLVSGPISTSSFTAGFGGNEFGSIAEAVAHAFLPFVNIVAILTIVISGVLAIIAQDENRIAATRKVVVGAITALILVNLASAIGIAIFDEFNYMNGATPGAGAEGLQVQIFGLLDWIEEPVMILALLTIVISGIRTVISFGGDQGLTQLRTTIISVIFGIVIIVTKTVVSGVIVESRTTPEVLNDIGINLTSGVLVYIALIAVAVLVIAGIYMIVNVGNDEQYTKAKNLVIRVVIGLLVIAVAAVLALFIGDTLLSN